MAFVIRAHTVDGREEATAVADRLEALRAALTWKQLGCKKIQVTADGRTYTLQEFAGTITIGLKADDRSEDVESRSRLDLSRETDVLW
jgi:hypothetical protein